MFAVANAETMGDRIRRAREKLGLTQEELGAKVGRTGSAIRSYESGRLQVWRHGDLVRALANALRVDERHLEGDDLALDVVRGRVRSIPIYTSIPAGEPDSASGDVENMDVLDWGTSHKRWGRIVMGDSMRPLLEPGDKAVFEDSRPESGQVVHAARNGEDCVKVLRRTGEGAFLEPLNPAYEKMPADGWDIKGRLVAIYRDLGGGLVSHLENRWGIRPDKM